MTRCRWSPRSTSSWPGRRWPSPPPTPCGAAGWVALLVPARTVSDAAKMMSAGTEVAIMLGPDADRAAGVASAGGGAAEAMIGFDAGERRLTARLLAGEFVRYRS